MAKTTTPKQDALARLRKLTGVRVSAENDLNELFPFGYWPPSGGRKYDDRSIAIIVGTVIEQALEAAIMTKLRPLDGDDERALFFQESSPMQTLSQKTTMAYALGLIGPKARADLNIIREIRNAFAHSRLPITFDDPIIKEAYSHVSLYKRWPDLVPFQELPTQSFIETAFQYVLALITHGHPDQMELSDQLDGEYWSCLTD